MISYNRHSTSGSKECRRVPKSAGECRRTKISEVRHVAVVTRELPGASVYRKDI